MLERGRGQGRERREITVVEEVETLISCCKLGLLSKHNAQVVLSTCPIGGSMLEGVDCQGSTVSGFSLFEEVETLSSCCKLGLLYKHVAQTMLSTCPIGGSML